MPKKNQHSHVGDAFGYLMLGGGEHRYITRGVVTNGAAGGLHIAKTDFDVI